jgi:hypothetical protein
MQLHISVRYRQAVSDYAGELKALPEIRQVLAEMLAFLKVERLHYEQTRQIAVQQHGLHVYAITLNRLKGPQ